LYLGGKAMQRVIDRRSGHHQPRCARRLQLGYEIVERRGSTRTFLRRVSNAIFVPVKDDASMAAL
jgi:hypothetical protein